MWTMHRGTSSANAPASPPSDSRSPDPSNSTTDTPSVSRKTFPPPPRPEPARQSPPSSRAVSRPFRTRWPQPRPYAPLPRAAVRTGLRATLVVERTVVARARPIRALQDHSRLCSRRFDGPRGAASRQSHAGSTVVHTDPIPGRGARPYEAPSARYAAQSPDVTRGASSTGPLYQYTHAVVSRGTASDTRRRTYSEAASRSGS